MFKLLLAALSVTSSSAFKAEQTAPLPVKPALQHMRLRGGADVAQIAKYVALGTSAFMFLPAGRDVVSPGAEIMPDDDKLRIPMWDSNP